MSVFLLVCSVLSVEALRAPVLQPAYHRAATVVAARATCSPSMVDAAEADKLPAPPSSKIENDKRAQLAKARRAIASNGKGGVRMRKGAKKSEQKAAVSGRGFGTSESTLNFDRRPKLGKLCGCGLSKPYGECCAPIHQSGKCEDTEMLVRSRFTAFKYRLPDFLMATTDPEGAEYDADTTKWKKGVLGFCDDFDFQSLEVGEVEQVADDATLARAAFRVNFVQKGTLNLMVLCEQSTFRKVDGNWLYADGQVNYEAQGTD